MRVEISSLRQTMIRLLNIVKCNKPTAHDAAEKPQFTTTPYAADQRQGGTGRSGTGQKRATVHSSMPGIRTAVARSLRGISVRCPLAQLA